MSYTQYSRDHWQLRASRQLCTGPRLLWSFMCKVGMTASTYFAVTGVNGPSLSHGKGYPIPTPCLQHDWVLVAGGQQGHANGWCHGPVRCQVPHLGQQKQLRLYEVTIATSKKPKLEFTCVSAKEQRHWNQEVLKTDTDRKLTRAVDRSPSPRLALPIRLQL